MKKYFVILINMVLFILFMKMIIVNQVNTSMTSLIKMLIALSGLLLMLYVYNEGKK